MNKKEYLEFHRAACDKMVEITAAKNNDYCPSEDDAFANFKLVEKLRVSTVEVGFLCRITDKLSRIISFMQKGELLVKDESVEDTILDLCNYSLLLLGYLKSQGKVDEKE